MSDTPEHTVTAEGESLGEAIRKAAQELGVPPERVAHKFNRDHFKSAAGGSRAVSTVRIVAWERPESAEPPPVQRPADPAPSRASFERSAPSERPPRFETEPSAPMAKAAPVHRADLDQSGGEVGAAWLRELLSKMGLQGTVTFRIPAERTAVIEVDTPDGRFLVGRRGTTLRAVQNLLDVTHGPAHPGWTFSVDVLDQRPERGERGPRADRGEDRGGRPPRRDRPGRRDDRPRHRTDDELEDLKRLARKLAEQALASGERVAIRRELNSFERRVVHVELAEMAGVRTESVMDGEIKRVIIIPDGAGEPAASGAPDPAASGE